MRKQIRDSWLSTTWLSEHFDSVLPTAVADGLRRGSFGPKQRGASRKCISLVALWVVRSKQVFDSGRWHIAYTQSAFERYVEGANPKHADRFIEKWPRPHEFAPGITLAFRIVTPWSAVTNLIDGSESKGVIWLPNAPEPKATEIDILFTAPTTPVSGWPGRRSMNTSLVGSVRLQNGETIWAVYWVVGMPDFASFGERTFRFYKGRSEKDLESEGLRMLVFGTEPDGSRVIYDCAVQGRKPNKPMQATQ